MKSYKKIIIITTLITILPLFVGLILWNRLPDTVATHWDFNGEANGWSSKAFAVLGLPCLLTVIHLFTVGVTLNDPKKKNIHRKMLALVFWITIAGAQVPSALLSQALFWVQDRLTDLFAYLGAPDWLHDALVLGAYRTLAWVTAVMLPPMAIFFPLFTLLEDLGYLPRVAFVLDHAFQKAGSCGKQALTM